MNQENLIWSGKSSNIANLGTNILYCLISLILFLTYIHLQNMVFLVFSLIPIIFMISMWITLKSTIYTLTTERLKIRRGLLNTETNELELYRVKDYKLQEPFWMKFFGLSNIYLETSDHSSPTVFIKAISQGEKILNDIRNNVEQCKQTKGIKEIDIHPQ